MAKFNKRKKDFFDADVLNGSLQGSLGICDTCIDDEQKIVYIIGAVASMCEFCLTHDLTVKEKSKFLKSVMARVKEMDNICLLCKGTGKQP